MAWGEQRCWYSPMWFGAGHPEAVFYCILTKMSQEPTVVPMVATLYFQRLALHVAVSIVS